jgi:lysophospholipase L1-like esterase
MGKAPLLLCAAAAALAAPLARAEGAGTRLVAADDPHFLYQGRLDTSDPKSPVLVWEASTAAIDFSGEHLSVDFGPSSGTAFFDATVDGAPTVLELKDGAKGTVDPLPVHGAGTHHLVLFKRSEAAAGSAHFDGMEVDAGAALARPGDTHRLRFEIYGDSITAGACAEDGATDQWESRRTHNAADSWAALTAGFFSADYRNQSVSGIGLAAGYDDVLEGQVWDRIYPTASAPKADLTAWVPDVVLVLLGDNDDSYPRSKSLPFPPDFRARYADLIHSIRSAYPKAPIVLLNGGMWAGVNSPWLRTEWGAVVKSLESSDPAISDFTFSHWTSLHPRAADHRILADELDAWLAQQPFMRALVAGGR